MTTTPPSLLEKLRRTTDQDAWREFVDLYTPLLYRWARQARLQEQDAADLLQDVFTTLVRKLPEFEYDPQRSFRKWLRTVTLNRWRDLRRRRQRQPHEGDPDALKDVAGRDECEEAAESEYHEYLIGRALRLMQTDFHPTTWKACWELVVNGQPAAEVARALGITENAVYVAKCRVLGRLRQELDGLLD